MDHFRVQRNLYARDHFRDEGVEGVGPPATEGEEAEGDDGGSEMAEQGRGGGGQDHVLAVDAPKPLAAGANALHRAGARQLCNLDLLLLGVSLHRVGGDTDRFLSLWIHDRTKRDGVRCSGTFLLSCIHS